MVKALPNDQYSLIPAMISEAQTFPPKSATIRKESLRHSKSRAIPFRRPTSIQTFCMPVIYHLQ
jgi:hypothetical protein